MDRMPAPPRGEGTKFHWLFGAPHAILLAFGIGVGEWVLGPQLAVSQSVQWMWVATLSIFLQVIFNVAVARYVAGTGQSVVAAFIEKSPAGKLITGLFYLVCGLLQIGWPVYVVTMGPVLYGLLAGQGAAPDPTAIKFLVIAVYVACLLIFLARRRAESVAKILTAVNVGLVGYIVVFLLYANLAFVPPQHWIDTFLAFFSFGYLGNGNIDWSLVGAVVGYAGAGGISNLMLSSLVRDQGTGLAKRSGAVTVGFSGREAVTVSLEARKWNEKDKGQVASWHEWMKLTWLYQIVIFGFFSFLSMYLTVNLATATLPAGTAVTGAQFGLAQAAELAKHAPLWWMFTLLNAFAILFTSQITSIGMLVELGTEFIGSAIYRQRKHVSRNVSNGILCAYILVSIGIIALGVSPGILAKLAANLGSIVLGIAALHLWWVNHQLRGWVKSPAYVGALLLVSALVFGGVGILGFLKTLGQL